MFESVGKLGGLEIAFWAFALGGTIFFVLRLVGMIFGGFGADHADGAGDDTGMDHQGDGTEAAFKLVSVNSLTGFFMMFGWSGLTMYRQFSYGPGASLLTAFVVGSATMAATAYLFRAMMKLQSSGDDFSVSKTLGLAGSVYMKIPSEGRGQIKVTYNGVGRIIDAISKDRVEIDSFQNIRVVELFDSNTVVVQKA